MAVEEQKEQEDNEDTEEAPASNSKRKLFLFIGIGVVVLALAVGAALFFTGVFDSDEASDGDATAMEEPSAPTAVLKKAYYYGFDPAFIVNFQDGGSHRYLQVDVEVMTRDETILEAMRMHSPMLRNDLLMLFGQQESAKLKKRDGKEQLRKMVLTEIQKVMIEETGIPGVESVFFTTFVMQ